MAKTKTEEAFELHKKGFNCAQAVALPFSEELGVDRQFVMRAMEGFGGGMGCYEQTCGALSGAIFVAGLKYSDGNLENPKSKQNTYKICKEICAKFTEECTSASCADIRGIHTKKPLKPCPECVALGVKLAEEAVK